MKRNLMLCLFAILWQTGYPQEKAGYLVDYFPAPGQYINLSGIGTPQAAQKAVSEVNSIVSLGSFGGYIILKLDNPGVNDPQNPYGIDFTVFGNSFAGSSEPGVIWVMKDVNRNGMPDDTWYEIAGSNHFFSGTLKNYEVTYYKTSGRDIGWKDNQGGTGLIAGNSFNLQDYYPMQEHFPDYPLDSVSFKGTLIENFYYTSSNNEIKLAAPLFGYADSRPKSSETDLTVPDNPYTPEIEGAGGDPIDISWAIDSNGNYIDLDSIHFVKIVTAGLDQAGWLGENSTEVAWIEPVKANPGITGKDELLVTKPIAGKIVVGNKIRTEAVLFKKGRKVAADVNIQSSDPQIGEVNAEGILEGKGAGTIQLLFSAGDEEQRVSVKVAEPQMIRIHDDFSAVYPGDTIPLIADVFDNWEEKLELHPEFKVSGASIGKIIIDNGSPCLVALQPGELTLTATLDDYQLHDQIHLKILSPDDRIRILVSVKTASENLLPLQWIEAGITGLNELVENRQNEYNDPLRLTAAHAIAAGLNKAGASIKFRDDDAADGKLYLYKVEYDGLFTYGWGGKTSPGANARSWIAAINGSHHLSGFDSLAVADGDTLVLYHVSDILESWNYTRLLPVGTSEGQTEFLLEQAICILHNDSISRSGYTPVTGASIMADQEYLTGADGKAVVQHVDFPLLVQSGADAVLLAEGLSTGISSPGLTFSVYPNPVAGMLNINFATNGISEKNKMYIKLFDAFGSLLIEKVVVTGSTHLDMSFFPAGLYHLVLTDGKRSQIKKVIKR